MGILEASPPSSLSTLWDIRHCGDTTTTTIHASSTEHGVFLSTGHPRCPHSPLQGHDPHGSLLIQISPLGNKAFAGHTHSNAGLNLSGLYSSQCGASPGHRASWRPHIHSPPSVMSSSRAHCPPLLRHDYSIHSVHSRAPWHPRTQARHCPSTCSQPFLHPLSTPEHGLPKRPAPSPNPHYSLQRHNQPPPACAFHIPKFLQLLPTLGRARFQSGTLGSCPPVTGAAGEQEPGFPCPGREGTPGRGMHQHQSHSSPTPGLVEVAEVGSE